MKAIKTFRESEAELTKQSSPDLLYTLTLDNVIDLLANLGFGTP